MAANRKLLAAAFAAISFLTAGPARAAVGRPVQTAPADGTLVQFLPAMAWTAVPGADKYEFQISADVGMNSPVLGAGKDDFFTRNTRATLIKTVPNGTYYWRVRATNAAGETSAWTAPRSFRKQWNLQPALQTPSSGAGLSFPANPVVLAWSGVAGAAHYLVSVASDPTLGSLVFRYANQDDPKGPPNVAATSAAITAALAPGAYYWSITPVDAEGNRGVATSVASFNWLWPSTTTPQLEDLNAAPEAYDPRFSWDPVAGAARYEVEINSSADFAPGSKVCCSGTSIATSLSPVTVFKDNVYYWRVRALDPDGNAGVWNQGASFTKTFDKVAPAGPVAGTSIKNLRMRDNLGDPGTDLDFGTAGYQTRVPVVTWDAVPGSASYEIQVASWTGSACSWATSTYVKKTSVPSWAPLGSTSDNPIVWQGTLAKDLPPTTPGTYCFRVRARSDRAPGSEEVWGDYTYLQDGSTGSSAPAGPAFIWTAYPDPADPAASAGCAFGYLCLADYREPVTGSTNGRTPLFTWKPLAGANSYFVVVAKDQNFSNVVDEGFTRIPAYSPRNSLKPTTYTDETTSFYWAVLPADQASGSDALPLDAFLSNPSNFQKQSTPPSLVSPSSVQVFFDQPTFRWTPTLGARRYRIQVSQDPSFGAPLDDVVTDATSYSSNTTYPADTVLYWRVRADDENLTGLTWSATGTFQKKLATPVPSASNPTSAEALPVWGWSPIQGASSYDVSTDAPDGNHRDFSDFRTPAVSFIKMTGTGVWHWRVRAEFPTASGGATPGPYSATQAFTRTIGEPVNAATDSSRDHVLLSWDPRLGVKEYKLQIASSTDFSRVVETVTTDNASYAPSMTLSGYTAGGTLYWRVAGVDEDRNQGDWTQIQQIRLQPRMRLSVSGFPKRKRMGSVKARVVDANGRRLSGVLVRVTGAGIRPVAKRTNAVGQVSFKLRPKKRGKLVFSGSKAGFQPAYGALKVR
ncbi:MAG: hypothetical protein M3R26_05000 [Actinomycetota bacterium]|nr:hypothetical protein [Actinomycetota bacterium]MDQ2981666.1 hypothetical protein [Actinomycetota bacterium]